VDKSCPLPGRKGEKGEKRERFPIYSAIVVFLSSQSAIIMVVIFQIPLNGERPHFY
jgi:hypothetical protein